VFPIGDDNPTRTTPYVTYGLIAVNVLVFLYEISLPERSLNQFLGTWAVVPLQFTRELQGAPLILPTPVPEWTTFITSQFLHGGFMHLGGNMLFLWIFGNNVEDRLGPVKFLVFYLGCGILAGLTQWFFSAGSAVPSLGASGAIAGVMGAYIIRFPKAPVRTIIPPFFMFPFSLPAFLYLGIWFVQQALYSIATLSTPTNVGMESGGIAYWAHAGGFVFGAILGTLLGLFREPERSY
jgi:membrane associated rhomboid family serine protease